MVTVIKKGSNRKTIIEKLKNVKIRKGIDASKYCGVINLSADPLEIQRALRNEWQ